MRLKNQDEHALQDHVFSTYITLRYGMAVLAIAFPLLLWIVGRLVYGIELQPSMSHYYFAPYPDHPDERVFPMRVWFVGLLFAIGACLYLYKGFTNWENVALNLAGGFAALVALFPMAIDKTAGGGALSLHGTFAVSLFVCLAFVAVFCAEATLPYLNDATLAAAYRRRYKLLGALMLASPLGALALTLVTNNHSRFTFVAEALGVWSFAAYWWVKSREMATSGAERGALTARIRPPKKQGGTVLPTFAVEAPASPPQAGAPASRVSA
jgi:hypothetical protein